MSNAPHVTVWNEFRHEKDPNHNASEIYPDGLHLPIAAYFREQGLSVGTATLDESEHGLTDDVLEKTDVMIWWGHMAHGEVKDEIVEKVQQRVMAGMGLIVLHSGHYSKIFRRLMGTTGNLRWREADEMERLWVVNPGHPIVAGVGDYIELDAAEMYGEYFDIPQPDELVFVSWFEGGNVFRSGCCWTRGRGRIFYFRPGHESYAHFKNPQIMHVIHNAVLWATPHTIKASQISNDKEPLNRIPEKV